MAKKSMATIQTGSGKNHTKVIKMTKNPKGGVSFKEEIVLNDKVKEWFDKH